MIKEAEAAKKSHQKQRAFLKPREGGGIQKVLVLAPLTNVPARDKNITNEKTQYEVDDQVQVFNVLLQQNFTHLLKSSKSLFTIGKLQEELGNDMEKELVDQLLVDFDRATNYDGDDVKYGDTLRRFLTNITRPRTSKGDKIMPFKWIYEVEEYKATFSKTREATSCGPSGLHMSHWKAALDSQVIMRTHAFLYGRHSFLVSLINDGK